MTTKVIVDPASHRVTVTLANQASEVLTEVLDPGSRQRAYYIYGDRVLTVRETPDPIN